MVPIKWICDILIRKLSGANQRLILGQDFRLKQITLSSNRYFQSIELQTLFASIAPSHTIELCNSYDSLLPRVVRETNTLDRVLAFRGNKLY
jgi:hypothetical protein